MIDVGAVRIGGVVERTGEFDVLSFPVRFFSLAFLSRLSIDSIVLRLDFGSDAAADY